MGMRKWSEGSSAVNGKRNKKKKKKMRKWGGEKGRRSGNGRGKRGWG